MAAIEGIDGVRSSSGNSRADAWKMAQAFREQGAETEKSDKAGDKPEEGSDLMADKNKNGIPDVIDALPLTDEEKQQLMEMMGMNGAQAPKEEGSSGGGGGGDKGGGGGGGDKAGGCPKSGGGGGGGSPQGAGGGGGPQGAGGGGGPQGPGANNLKAGDAGSSGPSSASAVGPGNATVDLDGDKKADVSIKGEGAEKYAEKVKEWTDKNPVLKQQMLEGAKANGGQFDISIQDLGPGSKGSTIAGLAPVGGKGEGVTDAGSVKIDTGDSSERVLVHEVQHNRGFKHGSDENPDLAAKARMDAEIERVLAAGG
jgi:hypothetical protein